MLSKINLKKTFTPPVHLSLFASAFAFAELIFLEFRFFQGLKNSLEHSNLEDKCTETGLMQVQTVFRRKHFRCRLVDH